MIDRPGRRQIVAGVIREAVRQRPRDEQSAALQAEVRVQPPRVVLLDDEPRRTHGQ
jgi:hypothetical protein